MLISDIMVEEVEHLDKSMTLTEAAEVMKRHRVGSIIVTERVNGTPVVIGILTDRDIVVEVVADGVEAKTLTVEDVMSREVITATEDTSLFTAIRIMERDGVRRLPVVDEKGALRGIVTADDIAGHLAAAIHSLSKIPGLQRSRAKTF